MAELPIIAYSRFKAGYGTYGIFEEDDDSNIQIDSANWANFDRGTNDFTLECWVNFQSLSFSDGQHVFWSWGETSQRMWFYIYDGGGGTSYLSFAESSGDGFLRTTNPWSISLDTWYHIAVVRAGITANDWFLFIDGVAQAKTWFDPGGTPWSENMPLSDFSNPATSTMKIGEDANTTNYSFDGYMDNFRFSTSARYTANFSPGTYPVTEPSVDGNTEMLVTFNGDVVDQVGNHTTTNSGVTFGEAGTELPINLYSRDGGEEYTTDAFTKLLLHLNNSCVDESGNNTVFRSGGSLKFDTFSSVYKKLGSHSADMNGDTGFAAMDDIDTINSHLELTNEDFVIDFWLYADSSYTTKIMLWHAFSSTNNWIIQFELVSSITLGQTYNQTLRLLTNDDVSGNTYWGMDSVAGDEVPLDEWVHIALVRSSSKIYFLMNGVIQPLINDSVFGDWTLGTISALKSMEVGNGSCGSSSCSGSSDPAYIDEYRISIGTDRGLSFPSEKPIKIYSRGA